MTLEYVMSYAQNQDGEMPAIYSRKNMQNFQYNTNHKKIIYN